MVEEREPFDVHSQLARIRTEAEEVERNDEDLALTAAAARAFEDSKAPIEERRRAANCLRGLSARCGLRGLVGIYLSGVVPHLVRHLEHRDDLLHQDVAVTLVNLSLYHGCRQVLQRGYIVAVVSRILAMEDQTDSYAIRQELALALLQNLCLSPQTHVEVLESAFMHHLPRFLGGGTNIFIRHKARLAHPLYRTGPRPPHTSRCPCALERAFAS